jgi:hypothetical protein
MTIMRAAIMPTEEALTEGKRGCKKDGTVDE